jgi:hypothetical protein
VTEPLDELRSVVEQMPDAPPAMASYLATVRERAYTLTNADVEALKEAGCGEDEIFEQTVAVAIAEGLRRLDAAKEVLG